jgi:arylsulfatase A-like enzyme
LDDLRRFPAADVIVTKASEWLGEVAGRPFFLWLHLMDPHSPYYPPEEALRRMGEDKIDAVRARYLNSYWNRADLGPRRLRAKRYEVVALYDAGIRWVDTQLARLVENLRTLGVWDKCVFSLTADHGEEFLEHGGRYHPPSITPELTHVPLLIRAPGLQSLEKAEKPFSLIHLGPTLLEAVGTAPPREFRGVSQWSQRGTETGVDQAVVECIAKCTNPFRRQGRIGQRVLAVLESRYQLVMDFATGKEQLFDVESDPGQVRPLPPGTAKPERRRLLEAARQHLAESLAGRDAEAVLAARLRHLQLECSGPETELAGDIEG